MLTTLRSMDTEGRVALIATWREHIMEVENRIARDMDWKEFQSMHDSEVLDSPLYQKVLLVYNELKNKKKDVRSLVEVGGACGKCECSLILAGPIHVHKNVKYHKDCWGMIQRWCYWCNARFTGDEKKTPVLKHEHRLGGYSCGKCTLNCTKCDKAIAEGKDITYESKIYHAWCSPNYVGMCLVCDKWITGHYQSEADFFYHPECWDKRNKPHSVCGTCKKPINEKKKSNLGVDFHPECWDKLVKPNPLECWRCEKPITGEKKSDLNFDYHPACWEETEKEQQEWEASRFVCIKCSEVITGDICSEGACKFHAACWADLGNGPTGGP